MHLHKIPTNMQKQQNYISFMNIYTYIEHSFQAKMWLKQVSLTLMKSSQKYIGVRLCLKQGREKQDYIKNLGQEFQEDAPVKDICYTEREREWDGIHLSCFLMQFVIWGALTMNKEISQSLTLLLTASTHLFKQ